MNHRFNTRRSGTERDRYEADRGNARSDRERYEFSDRDESSYRGWAGEGSREDEHRTAGDDFSRNESEDDRDRWTTAIWDRANQAQQGQRGFRPSSDFRGQGYGGVGGYEGREYQGQYGDGGGAQAGAGQFGHRGYGGSMGGGAFGQGQGQGGQGGYGQRNMSYGGMGNQGVQNPGVHGGPQGQYGQGQYGHTQYGYSQSGQGNYGQFCSNPYAQYAQHGQGQAHAQFGQQQQPMQQMQRRVGKGPKGYKRSDERIKEDVCDQLAQSDDLDPSEIEVSVSNAEVTLTGTIPERHMKYIAEQIADRVSGVNEIHNQIRVKRADQQEQAGQPIQTQAGQQAASLPLARDMQQNSGAVENGRRGGMRS